MWLKIQRADFDHITAKDIAPYTNNNLEEATYFIDNGDRNADKKLNINEFLVAGQVLKIYEKFDFWVILFYCWTLYIVVLF